MLIRLDKPSSYLGGTLASASGGAMVAGYQTNDLYQNLTPVPTLDQDTGVRADAMPTYTDIKVICFFTVNASGTQYAIAADGYNDDIATVAGVRLLRSAEPVDGGGDVAFAAWYDATTETYHYSIDVDGGGKTLNSVVFSTRTLVTL